jgi:hypothetical protein
MSSTLCVALYRNMRKNPPYGIYDRKRCSKEDSNNTTHIATGRRNDWELRSSLSSCYFLSTLRDNLSVQSTGVLDSWPLKMGPMSCPETSVRDCHYSLPNNPGERSSYLLRDGTLKSRKGWLTGLSLGIPAVFDRIMRRTLVRKDLMAVFSVILYPYTSAFGMNTAVHFESCDVSLKLLCINILYTRLGLVGLNSSECQTRLRGRRQALHFIFSVQSVTSARAASRGSSGVGFKKSSLPHLHNYDNILTLFKHFAICCTTINHLRKVRCCPVVRYQWDRRHQFSKTKTAK